MKQFVYRARFEAAAKKGIVVTFPDVPEAITQGRDAQDARIQAAETLGLALLSYPLRGLPLPHAKARAAGLVPVSPEPEVAAKLAVLDGFRESGLSKSDLARMLRKDEKEVRRILDPRHPTKLPLLSVALMALGRRLVIGVEKAA